MVMKSYTCSIFNYFNFHFLLADIQFWRNRESLEGLSVRSVFFNVFQSLIVLLYVLDHETNTLIRISCFIGLGIEIWKIHKVKIPYRLDAFYFSDLDVFFCCRWLMSKLIEKIPTSVLFLFALTTRARMLTRWQKSTTPKRLSICHGHFTLFWEAMLFTLWCMKNIRDGTHGCCRCFTASFSRSVNHNSIHLRNGCWA